jgi:hypothetical protein
LNSARATVTQIILLAVVGTLFLAGVSVLTHRTRKLRAEAVVDVRGDAGALCKRALREVAGSMTSEQFSKRQTWVNSHLPGEGTASASVGFRLDPLEHDRTRVTIRVVAGPYGGELNPRMGRKRAALAEALAGWLAAHGDGERHAP